MFILILEVICNVLPKNISLYRKQIWDCYKLRLPECRLNDPRYRNDRKKNSTNIIISDRRD